MNMQLFSLVLIFGLSYGARFPSYLKKCDRKQSDFNECFQAAVQKVVDNFGSPNKELGIPIMDPLEIPKMSIGVGTGPVAFTQDYNNIKLKGLSTGKCVDVLMDFEKKIMKGTCTPPQTQMEFNYEYKGQILLLPLYGKGPGRTTMVKPINNFTFHLEEYENKGKKFFKIVNSTFGLLPERLSFDFENLFGQDETLSKNMNELFNENWRAMYDDVGSSYEEAFAQILKSIFNNTLRKFSISDLFGDE